MNNYVLHAYKPHYQQQILPHGNLRHTDVQRHLIYFMQSYMLYNLILTSLVYFFFQRLKTNLTSYWKLCIQHFKFSIPYNMSHILCVPENTWTLLFFCVQNTAHVWWIDIQFHSALPRSVFWRNRKWTSNSANYFTTRSSVTFPCPFLLLFTPIIM